MNEATTVEQSNHQIKYDRKVTHKGIASAKYVCFETSVSKTS